MRNTRRLNTAFRTPHQEKQNSALESSVSGPWRATLRALDPLYVARMMDLIIAYAERGAHYLCPQLSTVRYERLAPLAKKLRALVVEWSPPDLPAEITKAA